MILTREIGADTVGAETHRVGGQREMTMTSVEYRVDNLCELNPNHPHFAAEVEYQLNQLRSCAVTLDAIPGLVEQLAAREKGLKDLSAALSAAIIILRNAQTFLENREKEKWSDTSVVGLWPRDKTAAGISLDTAVAQRHLAVILPPRT